MFTELSDVIVITPKGSRYFEEIPHKLIPALLAKVGLPKAVERAQFYTVMLEYGRCYKDESVVLRNRYCGAATCYSQSNLIHPVIRYYDTPLSVDGSVLTPAGRAARLAAIDMEVRPQKGTLIDRKCDGNYP